MQPGERPSEPRLGGLTWRDPVLWLVIGLPASAVIAGFFTLWLAISHRDPLVTDDVVPSATATAPAPSTTADTGPGDDRAD